MSAALLRKSHYKILFAIYLISLVIYPLLFYSNLSGYKQVANFLLISLMFVISVPLSFEYLHKYNVKKGFLIALVLLIYLTLVSLLRNSPDEYIPSFIRYFVYLFVFSIGYIKAKNGILKRTHITQLVVLCTFIAISFGILEFVTGNVAYFNAAFRITGNFSGHSLGYALFLFVITIYLYNEYRLSKRKQILILTIVSFIFLYLTQSRALILLAFLVFPISKLILNGKISYRILSLVSIFILAISFYYIVPNYLTGTRLYSIYQILFEGQIDGSTMTRIYIITESLEHLSSLDKVIGIGLGGFNEYFFQITGRIGHAAHNIYLQLFVEGGWIGLTLFIFLQFLVILKLKKNYERTSDKNKRLLLEMGLALFLGIEVLGFLLNAHYFYQSQILFMLILGFIISVTE